jgi:RHS repeat-associated protein
MSSTVPAIPAGLFFYDANDRLNSDAYDAGGNTTGSGGVSYTYDFENRIAGTSTNITIVYNGDGNRVRKTVGGVSTTYVVDDGLNPTGYAQVLRETTANPAGGAAFTREYVYGLDLISQRRFVPSCPACGVGTFTVSYYAYDGHGSVRQLTDSTGVVTDTYTYDAFGNLISRTGTTPNHYLYAGEQFDEDLALYYNRARYLSTTTGRFWSADAEDGEDEEAPVSLNKYLYANANPVAFVDPAGEFGVAELTTAFSISQTLNGMTQLQGESVKQAVKMDLEGVQVCYRGLYRRVLGLRLPPGCSSTTRTTGSAATPTTRVGIPPARAGSATPTISRTAWSRRTRTSPLCTTAMGTVCARWWAVWRPATWWTTG